MKRSPSLLIVFLVLLLPSISSLLQGCMVKRERVELGPLYYHRELHRPEATESAILWPFFQKHESPTVQEVAFRPLLNIRKEETNSDLGTMFEVQGLWPLFLYRKTEGPTRLKARLLPVFHYSCFRHPDGPEEVDTALYPFLLAGRSEQEGNYLALFPLAGKLHGFFAKNRIRFLLFPLYADTTEGEHRSWHFLWPFVRYSKGGKKSSFRLWPLFGWKQKEGRYKKLFVLWPFFSRVQKRLGSEHPTDSWFFLPFYGRQQTPFGKIQYFLYPFFSYQRQERPGNRFREWTLPWPIIRLTRGDRVWRSDFWPLWGQYKKEKYSRTFFLYPICRSLSYGDPTRLTRRRYVLPLYWSWSVTDQEGRVARKRIKGWPLFDYSVRGPKAKQMRTLSPLWFWRPEGGFERNYSDFWKLYVYRLWPEGLKERKILWYRWYSMAPHPPEEQQAPDESPEGIATPESRFENLDAGERGLPSDSPLFQGLFKPKKVFGIQ